MEEEGRKGEERKEEERGEEEEREEGEFRCHPALQYPLCDSLSGPRPPLRPPRLSDRSVELVRHCQYVYSGTPLNWTPLGQIS